MKNEKTVIVRGNKIVSHNKSTNKKRKEQSKPTCKGGVKIIPLGGLEEIGMNITAFEYDDTIIVVDCGISFPDENTPGVDLLIPDVNYLKDNIEKVKGFFITHAHEDHIGALPFVLKEVKVPIYGARLTLAIIENKLEQHKMKHDIKRIEVAFGEIVEAGSFKIEFIKTNHSIQDSAALAIYTPKGIIVHTGDFKVDYTPVFGDPINLARFAALGQQGVLALLCDSTNAAKQGFTMSEKSVGGILNNLFSKYKDNRILIATFASNVDRVQQIINEAYRIGKKVIIDGRSMITIIGIAVDLGYITLPPNTLIDIEHINDYEPEQLVIIMTGSQGEEMSALPRVSLDKHSKIHITPKDVVILSSHPIPGNEKAIQKVINNFMERGVEVAIEDTHVSGHACKEDIKLIYSLIKPKYAIPIHGNFTQRMAQANLVKELGYDKEYIKVIKSGNILEISENNAEIVGNVPVGHIMVDGNKVGNVGNIVINERKQLSTEGIIIVIMTLMEQNNEVLSGPEIICKGFVYIQESKELLKRMYDIVEDTVRRCTHRRNKMDWETIKDEIRFDLCDFLWNEMKARPMILTVIMGV